MNRFSDGYPEPNRPVIIYEIIESGIERDGRETLAYKKVRQAYVVCLRIHEDFKFWSHATVVGNEAVDFFRPVSIKIDKNSFWIYCPE